MPSELLCYKLRLERQRLIFLIDFFNLSLTKFLLFFKFKSVEAVNDVEGI